MGKLALLLIVSVSSVVLSSCGSGSSTLQSITIHQQVATDFPQFTATGTLSNRKQVSSLAVSWLNFVPVVSFVTHPAYRLTATPFLPQCDSGVSSFVVAMAPADLRAPTSGEVPLNVFQDLVNGNTTSEGGFVATRVQLSCP